MMHYQLRCGGDHRFDGWFKDSAAFEVQAERGLIACPSCGDTDVGRALMTPAVLARSRTSELGSEIAPRDQLPVLPDQVRSALQRLRAEVEARCDYVGSEFAEEARRIHHGLSERRGIYGEALLDQAEALAEEGIEVACIPWLPRSDS